VLQQGAASCLDSIVAVGRACTGCVRWRFAGNFFLDPWLGVHATLNPESVPVGPYEYKPPPIVANGSVKVGVFLEL
jgi:hypothetical protein